MKVLIAGDTGLLGQALVEHFLPEHQVAGFSSSAAVNSTPGYNHSVFNLLSGLAPVEDLLKKFSPELMINCTGLVDVKRCEEEKDLAWRMNAELPGLLAKACALRNTKFIHISTDQVFDGKKSTPYEEQDIPAPTNQYGVTKLAGEESVLKENSGALVLRTNIVGWRGRAAAAVFAEWLSESLVAGSPISLAEDFVTSSIHVDFFCQILHKLYEHESVGMLHAAAKDAVSKYEFGRLFAEAASLDFSHVRRAKLSLLGLKPPRPPFLALSSHAAQKFVGTPIPSCEDSINLLAKQFLKMRGVIRGA